MKNQFEQPKVIKIDRTLELQEKKTQETIGQIRERIDALQRGKEQYEEWQRAALEHGDKQNALLYEIEALENDVLIAEGELICTELEQKEFERWEQHFKHAMEIDLMQESKERLECIDGELEFVSDYIKELLEEENISEENRQRIEELQKRKEKLEKERLEYEGKNGEKN